MDDEKAKLTDEILGLTPVLRKVLEDMNGGAASLSVFLLQSIAKTCDEATLTAIVYDLRQFIVKQKGEDYLLNSGK